MTTLQVKSALKDPKRVLLALGSNVDKWHHLSYAVAQLRQRWHVVWESDIIETEAVGMEAPSFCNMLIVLIVVLGCVEFEWIRMLISRFMSFMFIQNINPLWGRHQ